MSGLIDLIGRIAQIVLPVFVPIVRRIIDVIQNPAQLPPPPPPPADDFSEQAQRREQQQQRQHELQRRDIGRDVSQTISQLNTSRLQSSSIARYDFPFPQSNYGAMAWQSWFDDLIQESPISLQPWLRQTQITTPWLLESNISFSYSQLIFNNFGGIVDDEASDIQRANEVWLRINPEFPIFLLPTEPIEIPWERFFRPQTEEDCYKLYGQERVDCLDMIHVERGGRDLVGLPPITIEYPTQPQTEEDCYKLYGQERVDCLDMIRAERGGRDLVGLPPITIEHPIQPQTEEECYRLYGQERLDCIEYFRLLNQPTRGLEDGPLTLFSGSGEDRGKYGPEVREIADENDIGPDEAFILYNQRRELHPQREFVGEDLLRREFGFTGRAPEHAVQTRSGELVVVEVKNRNTLSIREVTEKFRNFATAVDENSQYDIGRFELYVRPDTVFNDVLYSVDAQGFLTKQNPDTGIYERYEINNVGIRVIRSAELIPQPINQLSDQSESSGNSDTI